MSATKAEPRLGYAGPASCLPNGRGAIESTRVVSEIAGVFEDAPAPVLPRIAIAGKLASGKTTAALALVEQLGFEKMALADSLKATGADIADWLSLRLGDAALALKNKTTPLGRAWLQWLGTEGLRSRLPDIWVQILLRRIDHLQSNARIVTDDVRFRNEAEALQRAGFLLVRVDTPESVRRERVRRLYPQYDDSVFQHQSETALDDWTAWDFVLDGAADIETFKTTSVSWVKLALKIDRRV